MSKIRVYQLAKEYNLASRDFVSFLKKINYPVKNHMSALSTDEVDKIKSKYNTEQIKQILSGQPKNKPKVKEEKKQEKTEKKPTVEAKQKPKTNQVNKPKDKPKPDVKEQEKQNVKARETEKPNSEKKNNFKKRRRGGRKRKRNQNEPNVQAQNTAQNQNKTQKTETKPKNQQQQNRSNKNRKKKNNNQPVKLRDNSRQTKNKKVDYRKQRNEHKLNQKRNKTYEIPELLTVGELADILEISATEIIKELMKNGTMATINQQIDADTAQIVCADLGYDVVPITTEDALEKIFEEYDNTKTGKEIKRPPVVTVMGHVDHGKTSLLDQIRNSNVTAGEAGGITQKIGAYTVSVNGEKITFIDTPGHAAFTAMRSRGAQMTDIAVLVVAADDGVMPQTIEAINHAKVAEVPIIVAINKIDKEGANPERVKNDLTEHGILVEEWGGDTIAVPISAKKGTNIDELLENILLVAEIEELEADPNRLARGAVIESEVKKGKGATASLLIQHGTLKVGDTVLSGTTYGKIRTMIDDKGRRIKKAGPSTPVEISGLNDIPSAGDDFIVLEDEKLARQIAEQEQQQEKINSQKRNSVNLNDLFDQIKEGEISDVNIIVKADVMGSVEALRQSLEALNTDEVRVNVIHGAVGAVNETDVMLASTAGAIIIAFNVRSDRIAKQTAENEDVDIRYYNVIYDALEDVKNAMEGLLEPEFVEADLGEVEVRDVFKLPGGTRIAGSYVTNGKVSRGDSARVVRDGVVIYQGNVASLRRFKDDVKEVVAGYECGIGIENMNDIKVGDIIELYELQAVKREL